MFDKFMSLREWRLNREIDEMEMRKDALEEGLQIGMEKGMQQGLQQGHAEGLIEGKAELIFNMLNRGLDLQSIGKFTGLSEEEINGFIAEYNKEKQFI